MTRNTESKANIDLDLKKGKYNVTVTFGGNENYSGNNTTQKLTIEEEVVETVSETTSSSYTTEPVYDGHTISYQKGVRRVYSESAEFFINLTQDPSNTYL